MLLLAGKSVGFGNFCTEPQCPVSSGQVTTVFFSSIFAVALIKIFTIIIYSRHAEHNGAFVIVPEQAYFFQVVEFHTDSLTAKLSVFFKNPFPEFCGAREI